MKQFLAIYLTLSVIIASVRAIKPKQFFYETSLFSWSTEQTYSEGLTDYLEVLDVCDINSSYQYFSDEMLNSTYPREYIKKLNEQGISTYYLSGNPTWATARRNRSMREKITLVSKYNRKVAEREKFTGIVFDVEPYLLSDWKKDKNNIMDKFLDNMKDSYQYAKEQNLELIVCVPYWFDNDFYHILEQLIADACDKLAVMNYYRNSEIKNIENELELCRKYGKTIICISELQKPVSDSVPDTVTYYNYGLIVMWRMWNHLYSHFDYSKLEFSYHYYKPLRDFLDQIKVPKEPVDIIKPQYQQKIQYPDGISTVPAEY